MKKKIITGAVIVAVIAVLAIPKLNFFGDDASAGDNTSRGKGGNLPVEITIIKAGTLSNKVVVTGSVFANESLEVKGEISGKITSISFQEGKRVSKGELLVQINDEEIEAQLEKQLHNQALYKALKNAR